MSIRLCVVKAVFLYQKVVVHFISMLISVLTFFFCTTWKVVCLQFSMFLSFFFLFEIFCWDIFFILGVHHSRIRGSPMWNLKAFEGQRLRAWLCCRKISDSIFWLHCFPPH